MPPRNNNGLEKRIQRFKVFEEEKIPSMLQTIEGFVRSRNTFTESEFAEFAPLFQRPIPLTPEQHAALEKRLGERTSPFEPIRIVSDYKDENNNHRILLELPARLNNHHTINSEERNSTAIVDTFRNKTDDPNPLNLAAENATRNMMDLISNTISDDNSKDQNTAILQQAQEKIANAKKNGKSKKVEEQASLLEIDEESIDDFDDFDSLREDEDEIDDLDFEETDESLDDLTDDDD